MHTPERLILSVQGREAARLGERGRKVFLACDGSIGRSEGCDWVLAEEGISRQHAWVRYLNGIYFIEDRSTNGMLLNGMPLRKADPAALKDGDRLQIDTLEVAVQIHREDDSGTRPPAPPPAAARVAPRDEPAPLSVGAAAPAGPVGEGLLPGIDEAAGSLDPLALLGGPLANGEDAAPALPVQGWNHEPALADNFRAPRLEPPRAATTVLPENWDLTYSQFTPRPAPPAAAAAPIAEAAPVAPTPASSAPAMPAPAPAAPASKVAAPADVAATAPPPAPPDGLEELFRIAIDGMMDALRARAELKNTFRLPVTIIQRRENNPLKFAPSAEDAVKKILSPDGDAFLTGRAALDDAIDDIRNHQMAMLAGVREAFQSLLAHFDPACYEHESDHGARYLPFGARHRAWERYRENFEALRNHPDECFRRLFGDEFARAYEEQLARLKARPGPGR